MQKQGDPVLDEQRPEIMNAHEHSSSEDELEDVVKPAVRNRFDLLFGASDEETVKKSEDESEEEEQKIPVVKQKLKENRPQKKRNRKKKRKNGGKTIGISKEDDSDWEALLDQPKNEATELDDDELLMISQDLFRRTDGEKFRSEANEIFHAIRQIAEEQLAQEALKSKETDETLSKLSVSLRAINVEPRLLSADAELKKLFGSRVVEAERRAEEQENANSVQRRTRGRRRVPPRAHIRRKISLVSPRDGWFSEASGLSMVVDSKAPVSGNGIRYFRYTHEGTYESLQQSYRTIVASHDVNGLASLAQRYPFHVDSLIQLAEVHREMGELDQAAEHIERALYVLESSWNLAFKPYQGDCRLRFEVPENKAIYIALFRYAQLLTRRGLHRTALEISKLVLNFDPENDPMGILMIMDSLALLSGENEWIYNMHRDFTLIPLKYFPNFAFSNALAVHYLQTGEVAVSRSSNLKKKKKKGKSNGAEQGDTKTSASIVGESPPAVELLTNALLTYPMALRPLLAATKDSGGAWSGHRLFNDNLTDISGGIVYRMCRVFAERSNLLWNAGSAKALLTQAAIRATEISDKKSSDSRNAQAVSLNLEASMWLADIGLYRSVQISDFADGNANLPPDMLAEGNAPVGPPPPRQVTTTDAMREFMQSLLPWRNAGDAATNAANAGNGGQAFDAMLEMLENLLPGRGVGGGGGGGGGGGAGGGAGGGGGGGPHEPANGNEDAGNTQDG